MIFTLLVGFTVFVLTASAALIGYAYGTEAGKREPLEKLRKQVEEENAETAAEKYMRRRAYEER